MSAVYNRIRIIKILLSVSISLIFILGIWQITGICFETNDDKFITEILSGTLTGKPDPHAVFLNYLLSYPLHLLYRMTTDIPWYGGMLVLCHFLAYVALLQSTWSRCQTNWEYLFTGGLVCCAALANLYITAAIQFTSTAALMAIAGYTCLLLHKNYKTGMILFFLFEMMAFFIRVDAMLMIQPLGAAVCIGVNLTDTDSGIKVGCKKAADIVLTVILIFIIGWAGNQIGYHSKEWKEYIRFNTARAEIFDYYGAPDYKSVKPLLDKYAVTQAEYEGFCYYVIMDWEVSADCAEALAEHLKNSSQRSFNVVELLKKVWSQEPSAYSLNIGRVAEVTWILLLLWGLLRRRFRILIPLGGLAIGKTLVWGYLFYKGRLPLRVCLPLFICESILLLALLVLEYFRKRESGIRLIYPILSSALFFVCCVFAGKMQYREAIRANEYQEAYLAGLVEIQDYCASHPENRYLLDSWSFSHYKGSVFTTEIYGKKNYAYSGSWFSNSPASKEYLYDYFRQGRESLFLIVFDEADRKDYASAFFSEKLGITPVLADRVTVSHGGSYLIWYFGE